MTVQYIFNGLTRNNGAVDADNNGNTSLGEKIADVHITVQIMATLTLADGSQQTQNFSRRLFTSVYSNIVARRTTMNTTTTLHLDSYFERTGIMRWVDQRIRPVSNLGNHYALSLDFTDDFKGEMIDKGMTPYDITTLFTSITNALNEGNVTNTTTAT